jgi:hypothetical protein
LHAGWLFLCFAADGGLSFEQVQSAIDASALVISDPPRILNLDCHCARTSGRPRQTAKANAGDMPHRPTCERDRLSLRGIASRGYPDEVLARADADNKQTDGAPFAAREDYRAWVAEALTALTKLG